MKLIVKIESKYGRTLIYPVNDTAKTFAELINQKTLGPDHVTLIKTLGYEIEIEHPKLPVL
jgi:hypothetical protein